MRDLCPALQNKTYFNYGGQGPLPAPSLQAITASWARIQELGPFTADVWPYIATEVNSTRRLLAQCCGVPPHRLALTENVTSGCVLPLWGLPFAEGDRLLIGDCEHPGVVSACVELARRQNLAIDVLPVKHLRGDQNQCDSAVVEAIDQTLNPRTRLVVLSHLLWNTGQVMPIAAVSKQLLQHPQQPFLLVDAAQSFGQIPVEEAASAADIYAFTGHKWACGPEGLGGVALSERVLAEAAPTVIGWRSLRDESKADLSSTDLFHHDSRRFEVATSCVPLMAGLRSSLKLLEQQGSAQQRWERIRTLSDSLWQALQKLEGVTPLLDVAPASGLVSFQITGNVPPVEHVKLLGAQGLWIRDLADPSCLRACTHITTTEDDINALVAAISAL
ncbi:aminotransferase class V-fold PLP-dependent enzyme [Synechococcus sp. RS9902]|uniref:aminotransferase class V-fold PLP-dependent enzyme n=1 Tax=Synechococcus sp. RS9902 TaxID=221345 RepID=UPI001648C802|nr:aminotransferase class V-fold PLP-dependent enzyme [Synechococcus sp. RS9902]QNI98187.1 pyridoxal phosphate-dependent monomeric L-cysteine/cystine C-S-lyase [Synechococcus sp. RS9902]